MRNHWQICFTHLSLSTRKRTCTKISSLPNGSCKKTWDYSSCSQPISQQQARLQRHRASPRVHAKNPIDGKRNCEKNLLTKKLAQKTSPLTSANSALHSAVTIRLLLDQNRNTTFKLTFFCFVEKIPIHIREDFQSFRVLYDSYQYIA